MDRIQALKQRWGQLPAALRTPDQSIGRFTVGCGATHGVYERCDFGCTACYLGKAANRQLPMPFDEVEAQLKAQRAFLGPGGNVQITSGEVTLLPPDDLIRIVRTAIDLELSPMIMTHGDVLLNDPDYLLRLIREGGLRKLSFHVDTTQRGRKGWARPRSEAELNAVRDRCADLLRRVRRETGARMKAATTMTVNRDILPQLMDVVPWYLANTDAFRVLSFQPQAATGRTRERGGVSAEEVWHAIEGAVGQKLNPYPLRFGHPACNRIALILAIHTHRGVSVLEAVRTGNGMDQRFMNRFLADFSGVVMPGKSARFIAKATAKVFLRKPSWWWRIPSYGFRRFWQERQRFPLILSALFRRKLNIRACSFVVHAFMSRDQLQTEEGRERLEACTFRLAVNGELVSMCEMNATDLRESTYVTNPSIAV